MNLAVAAKLPVLFLSGLSVVSCDVGGPPEIVVGMDGCASCGMVIPESNQAAAFTIDREHYAFCSSGCLLEEYELRRQAGELPPDDVYFADYESSALIREQEVTFVLTERVSTVMNWGILGFGDPVRAAALRQGDELLVDWLGLRTLRGKVDRTLEVVLTSAGLQPDLLELEKGQLVEWVFRGSDLEVEVRLLLRGYEEMGQIVIPATGEPVTRRMLAVRPGDGFPLVRLDTEEVLGQVRIRGAHTADEVAP